MSRKQITGLVLARKVDQGILIGTDIVVTVHSIDLERGVVRLRIEAPPDVKIMRPELMAKIAANAKAEQKPEA